MSHTRCGYTSYCVLGQIGFCPQGSNFLCITDFPKVKLPAIGFLNLGRKRGDPGIEVGDFLG